MTVAQTGTVLSIHLQPSRDASPRPVDEARALVAHGLEGDFHGKAKPGTSRQVLLVDYRVLDALGFAHGALREQLTVDLPDLDATATGTRLRVGEAELEISGPCEPCKVIGQLNQAPDPEALRQTLVGRRGVLARVVGTTGTGRIRRGDRIEVSSAKPPSP
jgi:MOSC domain-containing protein YiiM